MGLRQATSISLQHLAYAPASLRSLPNISLPTIPTGHHAAHRSLPRTQQLQEPPRQPFVHPTCVRIVLAKVRFVKTSPPTLHYTTHPPLAADHQAPNLITGKARTCLYAGLNDF